MDAGCIRDVVRLCRERSANPAEHGFERYLGLEHLDPGDLKIQRWESRRMGPRSRAYSAPGRCSSASGGRTAQSGGCRLRCVCSGDIYVLETNEPEHPTAGASSFHLSDGPVFRARHRDIRWIALARTNWRSLSSYEFALSPLDEQRQIAEVFASVDRAVSTLRSFWMLWYGRGESF